MARKKAPSEWLAGREARWARAFAMVEDGTANDTTTRCAALVREGHGIPAIARITGLSSSAVGCALRDPTGALARCRKRKVRGSCRRCGCPTFNSGSRRKLPEMCEPCRKAVRREAGEQRILDAIADFAERYGRPPSAQDWNLSQARERAHPERLAQIESQHRDRRWPLVANAVQLFGTWNKAVEAAGFEPLPPGHRRGNE